MRVGLVARADNTGLGIQTYEFYRNMQPSKTMVVDISSLNGNRQYPERYPTATFAKGFPNNIEIDNFLHGLDVVFVAEAPYRYYLYARARELGIKTAVQYNYEFFDWFTNPHYPKPDMLIAPSRWHYEEIEEFAKANGMAHTYLHCPVNRDVLPYDPKTTAKRFLHIAGKPAAHDRNGTKAVIEASRLIEDGLHITIHFQGEQGLAHQATHNIDYYRRYLQDHGDPEKVTIQQHEYDNYQDVYLNHDVLILPRRYGGNCLPMNEALSVGMPVIMTAISPQDQFLPHNWLVPAEKVGEFTPRTTIDIYDLKAEDLAEKINEFGVLPPQVMVKRSQQADELASTISWETLKPKYVQTFENLVNG